MKSKIYKLISDAKRGLFVLALLASGTAHSQQSYSFAYTGAVQTLTLPAGNYEIRCWGANGGSITSVGGGGIGGYSRGEINITTPGTQLNILVGGSGTPASGLLSGNAGAGGWNGGGGGSKIGVAGAGGGGATDVRMGGLAAANRIIVAGGGGGAAGYYTQTPNNLIAAGGNGGGASGANGNYISSGGAVTVGGGGQGAAGATAGVASVGGSANGTATGGGGGAYSGNAASTGGQGTGGGAGGAAGNSGSGSTGCAGGGGGGYAGGAGGVQTSNAGVAGGGGSGYIGGVTSGSTTSFGQTGFVPNPDLTGNGRVVIIELCNITLVNNATNSFKSSICSGQSVTLTTNAVSNYTWSTGANTSSLVVSPSSTTVYTLTAMSPSNCVTSAVHTVVVSPGLPVLTINSSTNSICLGDSVTLTASGALSYTWTNGVNNGQIFAPTTTTSYTVSGENGCGITTTMVTVSVSPLQVAAVTSASIVCASTPATLTAGGANTYTWTVGTQTQTGTSILVAPAMQSVYTVTGSIGGCVGTNSVMVSTKANPTLNITSTGSMVCAGKSVTMTVSGADTYTWNPASLSGTMVVATPTAPILYQVSGTNSLGCTSGTAQVVITNPSPTLNVSASPYIICAGGQATLNAGGAHAYSWDTGPTTPVIVVNPNVSTTYTVTGTFTNTGCDASKTVAVTVFEPVLAISASTSVCPGSAVSLTAGPGSGYQWSTGSVFQGITVYPTQTSVYTVSATVTSSANLNCPASNSVEVVVYAKPTVTASATRTNICRGEKSSLTTGGAGTYLWSVNNNTTAAFTFSTNIITTHSISVIGTDVNGCKDTASVSIKVNSCNGLDEYTHSSIRLYPNPNNGAFVIESENALELEISNELGQLIRTISLNAANQQRVDITDLPQGIYFIKGSGADAPIRHKVIVNK